MCKLIEGPSQRMSSRIRYAPAHAVEAQPA
jgi:hypothetical protein